VEIGPNDFSDVTLADVLHIPTLGTNLVSMGTLHCTGATITSLVDGLVVSFNGNEIFHAKLAGSAETLYHIQCAHLAQQVAFATSGSTMQLWHHQMGHFSPSSICTMEQKDLVKGLKIHIPNDFNCLCAGCTHGKSHQLPLPDTSPNKYVKMELLIMDLTGPISIPTWDGNQYALVVVEVSCQYPVGCLLK
jgi:hypothetical protein